MKHGGGTPSERTENSPVAKIDGLTEGPRLVDDAVFDAAVAALTLIDPALRPTLEAVGPLRRRSQPATFAGIAAIIVAQQVSTASADAITARLAAAVMPLDPTGLRGIDDAGLKRCGLSSAKVRTLRALARAVEAGSLRLASLADMAPEDAQAALLAIPGIGPWTADIVLLFCLGHADAWPAGDLALQDAVRDLQGLAARPDGAAMIRIGARWRPYRGVAATLLWSHCRIMKRRVAVR